MAIGERRRMIHFMPLNGKNRAKREKLRNPYNTNWERDAALLLYYVVYYSGIHSMCCCGGERNSTFMKRTHVVVLVLVSIVVRKNREYIARGREEVLLRPSAFLPFGFWRFA